MKVNIYNTGGHAIGEKKKYDQGIYDLASWEYGTDYVETLSADEQVELVIAPLTMKMDELLSIKERFQCEFILMQVPRIENGEAPSLGAKHRQEVFLWGSVQRQR